MSSVNELIERASRSPRCVVHPPAGLPSIPAGLALPEDVREFYERCGGAELFLDADYGMSLLRPSEVLESNVVIIGEQYPEDRSASWFTIARTVDPEYVSIDLSIERNGRVYDSFHEIHAVAGSSTVIALSFTDLFAMLLDSEGDQLPWLADGFVSPGDAYDESC